MLRRAWKLIEFVLQRFPCTIGVLLGWAIIYSTATLLDWFLPDSFIDYP